MEVGLAALGQHAEHLPEITFFLAYCGVGGVCTEGQVSTINFRFGRNLLEADFRDSLI